MDSIHINPYTFRKELNFNVQSSLMHKNDKISMNSTLYLKTWISNLHCTIKDN